MNASFLRHPIRSEHWQLFIDDYTVARSTGFDRVVHRPRALGVVIPADRPWESSGVMPHLISRRDDGSFFAFYSAMWWDIKQCSKLEDEGFRRDRAHHILHSIGYAVSEDGIHWEKPCLNLTESPSSIDWAEYPPYPMPKGTTKDNNLGVPFIVVADLGQYGNARDPKKRYALRVLPDPSMQFDIGSHWKHSPKGYFAEDIPDFLNDPNWKDKLIDSRGEFDPRRHLVHFWDDLHEEWVAIEQGVWPQWLPTREIGRFASKDLVSWTSAAVLYPDAGDPHTPLCYDEPMVLSPVCAEGIVLGLLAWFHGDRTHPEGGPNLTATPEHPEVWPWVRKGTNEMRITISRDGGYTWDRTSSREPWIPHGTEPDSYDRCILGCMPPIQVGDEDWFYAYVLNQDHLITRNNPEQSTYYHDRPPLHQVALYTQKHNRYVSLRTRNQQEVLITRAIQVDGDELQLNLDANRGVVRVGIALADSVPTYDDSTRSIAPHLLEKHLLPNFSFEDCQPIHANSIEHTVQFNNSASIASLRGHSVHLLFQVIDADLYGFRIV